MWTHEAPDDDGGAGSGSHTSARGDRLRHSSGTVPRGPMSYPSVRLKAPMGIPYAGPPMTYFYALAGAAYHTDFECASARGGMVRTTSDEATAKDAVVRHVKCSLCARRDYLTSLAADTAARAGAHSSRSGSRGGRYVGGGDVSGSDIDAEELPLSARGGDGSGGVSSGGSPTVRRDGVARRRQRRLAAQRRESETSGLAADASPEGDSAAGAGAVGVDFDVDEALLPVARLGMATATSLQVYWARLRPEVVPPRAVAVQVGVTAGRGLHVMGSVPLSARPEAVIDDVSHPHCTVRLRVADKSGLPLSRWGTESATMYLLQMPDAPKVAELTDTSATLVWSIPEASADGVASFDVRIIPVGEPSHSIKTIVPAYDAITSFGTAQQRFRFDERTLAPDTEHQFRVRARYSGGVSAWSERSQVVRTRPMRGLVPSLLWTEPTSLHVEWAPHVSRRSTVESYELQVEGGSVPAGRGTGSMPLREIVGVDPAAAHHYAIADLEPAHVYRVRVRAAFSDGSVEEWPAAWSAAFSTCADSAPQKVQLIRQLSDQSKGVDQFTGGDDCAVM